MKALRWARRLLIALVLLAVAALFGVPAFLSSDFGRTRLEQGLSEALRRDVSIGSLDIGLFFSGNFTSGLRRRHCAPYRQHRQAGDRKAFC